MNSSFKHCAVVVLHSIGAGPILPEFVPVPTIVVTLSLIKEEPGPELEARSGRVSNFSQIPLLPVLLEYPIVTSSGVVPRYSTQ